MILKNTAYGYKQKLKIGGINSWNVLDEPSLNIVFYVEIFDALDKKVDDKTINQDRRIVYNLNNLNRVNASFNPVSTGGTGEYDFFDNLLKSSTSFYSIINSLIAKLNERGIFD